MLSSLIAWNYIEEAERVIRTYKHRIDKKGFFRSQEGEWDSNGQALWTLEYFARQTGNLTFLREIFPEMQRGAHWIFRKRREGYKKKLLPAGFSAEHLGPADYYYWDNLWSLGGLEKTIDAARALGDTKAQAEIMEGLEYYRKDFLACTAPDRERLGYLPAAPGRGPDGGLIGGVPLLYPLDLDVLPPNEVRATIFKIYDDFFPEGLFLQSVIHSGYNIYLSIQIAQCMLRLGETGKARRILKNVLAHRSELWTYPEALHPRSGGGVMGDGYHGWAFAEILLLLREFVIHPRAEILHVFRGLRSRELIGSDLLFGPFPLDGAKVTIRGRLDMSKGKLRLDFEGIAGTKFTTLCLHLPREIVAPLRAKGKITGARLVATPDGEDAKRCVALEIEDDRVELSFG